MSTSLPRAADLGILANGTDQTSALNTIFSNSAYAGVIIDFSSPAAVTISGTLNCQNKQLIFAPFSYITGSGTISYCIINAGYRQKCFDITITLNNIQTVTEYFSALWYGADDLGIVDSAPAIQRSLDMVLANTFVNTVFLPGGTYLTNSPLIMSNWNGTSYIQNSVNLIGEGKFWQGSVAGTKINCSFSNTFGLGIQVGKGNIIRGIYFSGKFTPPTLNSYQFYTCAFSAYIDVNSRDKPQSPYAGIVIDPFGPNVPGDGGYPGLTSNYKGGTGGSTGIEIEDCIIYNFVTGIITSPNGQTANAELMNWTKIQFGFCKACIVGCQTQEKMNCVTNTACWETTHTFFHTGAYGAGVAGNWYIKGVSIAGQLNQLINRNAAGYFPMHVSDVYAEGLGTVGYWTGSAGDSLQNCSFNFVTPDIFKAYPNFPTSSHFTSSGITIKSCEFRYYGWYLPLVFNGGSFEDCSFDQLPYTINAAIIDSYCFSGPINPQTDILGVYRATAARYMAGGRGKFVDKGDYLEGKIISLRYEDYNSGGWLDLDAQNALPSTFTVSSNVATVTPPSAADLSRAIIGRIAIDNLTGILLGVITAVGASTYTISYVPNGVATSSSYVISIWCPMSNFSFMGSTTAGSATITNVVLDFGNFTDLTNYSGGYVKLPGFYGMRTYTQQARVLSYNSGTATIVMDKAATFTATNYYFSSNSAIKDIMVLSRNDSNYGAANGISNTEIMPKGSEWTTDIPGSGRKRYMISLTGYYNATPQATWIELT